MVENILSSVVKDIRQYLYHSIDDERFGYWSGVPDWGSYLSSLKQSKGLGSDVSFGGMWIEHCVPSEKWALATRNWEYQIKIFLMRSLVSSKDRVKVQRDLLKIFRLIDNHGVALDSEFSFDRGELSLMMRRSSMALACGELKFCLLVNEE